MTSLPSDREVRRWARRYRIVVPERGVVPAVVRDAYVAWRRLEDVRIVRRKRV